MVEFFFNLRLSYNSEKNSKLAVNCSYYWFIVESRKLSFFIAPKCPNTAIVLGMLKTIVTTVRSWTIARHSHWTLARIRSNFLAFLRHVVHVHVEKTQTNSYRNRHASSCFTSLPYCWANIVYVMNCFIQRIFQSSAVSDEIAILPWRIMAILNWSVTRGQS